MNKLTFYSKISIIIIATTLLSACNNSNVETKYESKITQKPATAFDRLSEKYSSPDFIFGGYYATKNIDILSDKSDKKEDSNIIATVKVDEVIDITKIEDSWAYVLYKGQTGFVKFETFKNSVKLPETKPKEEKNEKAEEVSKVPENTTEEAKQEEPTNQKRTVLVQKLLVRSQANMNSKGIVSLVKGNKVEIISEENRNKELWSKIKVDGKEGYVMSKYISKPSTNN